MEYCIALTVYHRRLTKDLFFMTAVRTDMGRHIFDYTHHWNLHTVEQFNAFGRISNATFCGVVTITAPVTGIR